MKTNTVIVAFLGALAMYSLGMVAGTLVAEADFKSNMKNYATHHYGAARGMHILCNGYRLSVEGGAVENPEINQICRPYMLKLKGTRMRRSPFPPDRRQLGVTGNPWTKDCRSQPCFGSSKK